MSCQNQEEDKLIFSGEDAGLKTDFSEYLKDSLGASIIKQFKDSGSFVNGLKDGKWFEYADTSITGDTIYIAAIGNYSKGQREGAWLLYLAHMAYGHLPWELFSKTNYLHGKKNGNEILFRGHDTSRVATYVNGKPQGIIKEYESGRLTSVYKIENEKAILREEYFPAGWIKAKYTDTIIGGKKLNGFETFYPNKKTKSKGFYFNDELDGDYKYFHTNGKPWSERIYKEGKLVEVTCNYDAMGNSSDKGTMKNGNGTLILYDEEGLPTDTEKYVNGEKQE
ncbi:MAG: hypothetical protein HY063_11315 [Bacteroidetes bacterium]|nr:hypothetical protein [Bacteroidota bacterium]